jgi:hypothetical protein
MILMKPKKLNEATPQEWDQTATAHYVDPFDMPPADNVNHPPHYNANKIECIDYLEDSLGEGFSYYLEGAIKKYLHRWRYKHSQRAPVEDLRKARWYLDKLIDSETNKPRA